MSEKSETTIAWSAAVHQVALACGPDDAGEKLLELVESRRVQYEPRKALSLMSAYKSGLFNSKTGEWRMHARDSRPTCLRILEADLNSFLKPEANEPAPGSNDYMPEYLALIHKAIAHFSINDDNQPKAEELRGWFKSQTVDGAEVSDNLASVMTTIARKADRKKGGAVKRRAGG